MPNPVTRALVIVAYVVANALKPLAACWLWQSHRDGSISEFILLGLSVIFWCGFGSRLARWREWLSLRCWCTIGGACTSVSFGPV